MKLRRNLLLLSAFVSAVAFAIPQLGDELELTAFLNARNTSNFASGVSNVKYSLDSGTAVTVLQTKKFESGNFGLFVKITSGSHQGETAWVYYKINAPSLKLANSDRNTGANTQSPAVKENAVTTQAIIAHTTRKVSLTESNMDLQSSFACLKAIDASHQGSSIFPSKYSMTYTSKIVNGQWTPTEMLITDGSMIRSFPSSTNFFGVSDQEADRIFALGTQKLDAKTRAEFAATIRGSLSMLPHRVRNSTLPGNDSSDFPPRDMKSASAIVSVCAKVKDDTTVSHEALSIESALSHPSTSQVSTQKTSQTAH